MPKFYSKSQNDNNQVGCPQLSKFFNKMQNICSKSQYAQNANGKDLKTPQLTISLDSR